MLRGWAKDADFLNLFCYTGSATVYAAAGGARSTTGVDLSNTYLDWAHENLLLNGFGGAQHELYRADCLAWLEEQEPDGARFDLIFLDPPTFSNSKRMDGVLDVQRDHVGMIRRSLKLLRPGAAWCFPPITRVLSWTRKRWRIFASRTSALPLSRRTSNGTPAFISVSLCDSNKVISSAHEKLDQARAAGDTPRRGRRLCAHSGNAAEPVAQGRRSIQHPRCAIGRRSPSCRIRRRLDTCHQRPSRSGKDQSAAVESEIAKQIEHMYAEEKAGRPFPVIDHCFPTGMPSYMLITHNAFELLVTPGRVTLLGEGDGNRLRRIYTDGRPHPADPDPSFHGHSIGHWEGQTLVVDTIALLPQVYLAVNEAVGVPNNGDMHIVERIHLLDAETLADDLEIMPTSCSLNRGRPLENITAALAEVRHRRGRLRTGQLYRGRRQGRQCDLRAHQIPQRRSGRLRLEVTQVPMNSFRTAVNAGAIILAAVTAASWPAYAHHSFAVYDRPRS